MKFKSIFAGMFAAMAAMFVFSSCSSENEDPESYYQWTMVSGTVVSTTTSESTLLYKDWIEKKALELDKAYCGYGMFKSDAEPTAKADQLSAALQQALQDFHAACTEMDFGEGEYQVDYAVLLNKEGKQIKTYPGATFTYKEPSRFYLQKTITPADFNKDNQITLTVDDFKFEPGVTLDGVTTAMVYNDSDNTRINDKEIIKAETSDKTSLTYTFEDLSGKTGKFRILQPVVLNHPNGLKKETKLCIYLELKENVSTRHRNKGQYQNDTDLFFFNNFPQKIFAERKK